MTRLFVSEHLYVTQRIKNSSNDKAVCFRTSSCLHCIICAEQLGVCTADDLHHDSGPEAAVSVLCLTLPAPLVPLWTQLGFHSQWVRRGFGSLALGCPLFDDDGEEILEESVVQSKCAHA